MRTKIPTEEEGHLLPWLEKIARTEMIATGEAMRAVAEVVVAE